MATSQQRAYRAACPNCGAPVEFKSAASALAVCSFCSSTIARDGDALRRIGKQAELFDDHSPLQLGTSGSYTGITFTLIGRLQYRYAEGTWNEWHALFDNNSNGWLSEDNGRYVLSMERAAEAALPELASLAPGQLTSINNSNFTVASVTEVTLIAAQGELPRSSISVIAQQRPFTVVDLRSSQGFVATLDYSITPPKLFMGKSASLEELKLQNLRTDHEGAAEKTLSAKNFGCPNCGASIQVKLDGTKSITCGSCASVVDMSQGTGGDLQFYRQQQHVQPALPLGTTGKLRGVDWQVVGFQQRVGEDDEGERFEWQEYLLYNRLQGFAFLVDTSEGFSLVKTLTGAPAFLNPGVGGATARIEGRTYRESYRYKATTTYVAGEFYWLVKAGQRTDNIDFEAGQHLLSREESPGEVTWSGGERIEGRELAEAFKLSDLAKKVPMVSASPVSGSSVSIVTVIVAVVIILILLSMLSQCSGSRNCLRDQYGNPVNPQDPACYRSGSSGGYYGGGSGGGYRGHK
jgi:ribosomal protein S27AE